MKKKHLFINLVLCALLATFSSCSKDDNNPEDSQDETVTDPETGGKVTDWKDGYITYYDQPANNDSYPYPLPKMEKGYYNVAVGVYFFPDYILGSAYEIKYGDKTIRVVGKDICPDGDNSWFDNTPEGFEYLTGDKKLGKVNVKWRETPYYTDKNIEIRVKSGSNAWFLGVFVFNGRYGIKKLEVSDDGSKFHEMTPYKYNAFWELQCPFGKYDHPLTFRITDRYNHTVTTKPLNINPDGTDGYDAGGNFEY